MFLYVANCTNQNHVFSYRILGTENYTAGAAKVQPIGVGKQIKVAFDLDTPQMDDLIQRKRKYGMLAVSDIAIRGNQALEWPLIYSEGKPVPQDVIRRAMEHNMSVKMADAQETRRRLAVATSAAVEKAMDDVKIEGDLIAATLSVQEDRTAKSDTTLPQFSEGVRVSKSETDPRSPPRLIKRQTRDSRAAA